MWLPERAALVTHEGVACIGSKGADSREPRFQALLRATPVRPQGRGIVLDAYLVSVTASRWRDHRVDSPCINSVLGTQGPKLVPTKELD